MIEADKFAHIPYRLVALSDLIIEGVSSPKVLKYRHGPLGHSIYIKGGNYLLNFPNEYAYNEAIEFMDSNGIKFKETI